MKKYCGHTIPRHIYEVVKIIVLGILNLPLKATALIVVPIALLQCNEESERLPEWARWYDDYKHGINGDRPWRELTAKGRERTFWWRFKWLQRNCMTTFSHEVQGFHFGREIVSFSWYGNPEVGNFKGEPGFKMAVATDYRGKKYFHYYWIFLYTKKETDTRCFRACIGYKLFKEITLAARGQHPLATRRANPVLIQWACAINPAISFDIRGRQH